MQKTPECQYYPSALSSCLRRPTTHLYSQERGSLWVCVNKHLKEQDRRDSKLREQEMGAILHEKMMADGILLQQIIEVALNMLEPHPWNGEVFLDD